MRIFYALSSYLFLCFFALIAYAQEPLWTSSLPKTVEWSMVTSAGTLLVNTGSDVIHIDSETGETLWSKQTEKKLAPYNFHDLAGSGYLLVAEQFANIPPKTHLTMYNLISGEVIWESAELFASNLAVIPDLERGQVLFLGGFPGSPKDKTSGNLLTSYDIKSGDVRFQSVVSKFNEMPMHMTDTAGFFAVATDLSGHSDPVIEGSTLYLPYLGLMAVNLENGDVLWSQEFDTVDPGLKRTNSPIVLHEDRIYMSGRGAVVAVEKSTGEMVWKAKVKKSYAVPELRVHGDQIIARIGGLFSSGKDIIPKKPFGAMSINRSTGEVNWSWTKAKDSVTNLEIAENADQLFIADKKDLYRIALDADSKVNILEKRNLEFKRKMGAADTAVAGGKVVSGLLSGGLVGGLQGGFRAAAADDRADPPSSITRVGDDLIISGNYHVLSYNSLQNTDNWSLAFEPPGVHPMMLALSGATMALSAVGNAGMHTSWAARDAKLGNSLANADKLGSFMSRRFAAAQQAGRLSFYLTKAGDDMPDAKLQLMGINLASGDTVGAVPIDEKEPVFTVDNIGRKVYYFYKGNEIRAFGF